MNCDLKNLIGHTPLYRITLRYKGQIVTVYAKAEHYNYTGSIKDRLAYFILCDALKKGILSPGMRIAEATSGNTGISFAAVGAGLGMKVTIIMPDWMSEERKKLIQGFGADIRLVSREDGGFLGAIDQAEQMGADPEVFLPRQFENPMNVQAHYQTTGPEIAQQLQAIDITPDAFVAGVGTGGTIMGAGSYLKTIFPGIRLHPLEPQNSPTLSMGKKIGRHRIQGISDDFIPKILDLDYLDEILQADDGDAIIMAKKLSQAGIGVGISSGANLIGALKALEQNGFDQTVVTVFADDNKKYLSTDLMGDEPAKDHFLSNDVEILDLTAFR